MEALGLIWDGARLVLGAALVISGLALMLGGVIAQLRFPDFYTRLHGGAVEHVASVLIVLGLAVGAGDAALFVRLALLAALIALLAPALTQWLGGAAHSGGLAPLAGRYVAPRPRADERLL